MASHGQAGAHDASPIDSLPYKAGDSIEDVTCFCVICKTYKPTSWSGLLQHVRKKHDVKLEAIKHTWLYKTARKEENERVNARYRATKELAQARRNSTANPSQNVPGTPTNVIQKHPEGHRTLSASTAMVTAARPTDIPATRDVVRLLDEATAVIPSQPVADTDATPRSLNRVERLLEQLIQRQTAGDRWANDLPGVSIRLQYVSCECPNPSSFGRRTGKWPVPIEGMESVNLSEFEDYLVSDKNYKRWSAQVGDYKRALTRVMHMLLVGGKPITETSAAFDPGLFVSMYMNNTHNQLLSLNVLSPCYYWTRRVIEAMRLFAEFHVKRVSRLLLETGDTKWEGYKAALERLQADVEAGPSKRVTEVRAMRGRAKYKGDYNAIMNFPPVQVIQEGVLNAMRCLRDIRNRLEGKSATPPAMMGCANACIVFIIAANGFMGRIREWSRVLLAHFQSQIANGLDYLECDDHKTKSTYGDIAKWLADGTIEALQCYCSLPRRPEVTTLLHPANISTAYVDIAKALLTGSKYFLPDSYTRPRSNQWRKWYHSKMESIADTKEKLAKVFERIDAHSPGVQRTTYILRGPQDDAKLAKQIVELALGKPVSWPAQEQVQNPSLEEMLEELMESDRDEGAFAHYVGEDDDDDGGHEEDDDNTEMAYFQNAECFGIPVPLTPIAGGEDRGEPEPLDGRVQSGSVVEVPMPAAPEEVSRPKKEDKTKSSSKDKKKKRKEKRDKESRKREREAKARAALKERVKNWHTQRSGLKRRCRVEPSAHTWMDTQLRLWQLEHKTSPMEYPRNVEWYWAKREEAIKKQILTEEHSPDVVRSYIQSTKRKAIASESSQPESSLDTPPASIESISSQTSATPPADETETLALMCRIAGLAAPSRQRAVTAEDHTQITVTNSLGLREMPPPKIVRPPPTPLDDESKQRTMENVLGQLPQPPPRIVRPPPPPERRQASLEECPAVVRTPRYQWSKEAEKWVSARIVEFGAVPTEEWIEETMLDGRAEGVLHAGITVSCLSTFVNRFIDLNPF